MLATVLMLLWPLKMLKLSPLFSREETDDTDDIDDTDDTDYSYTTEDTKWTGLHWNRLE